VSARAVAGWEGGSNYPKTEHLKVLIEVAVEHQAFPKDAVAEEIRRLWKESRQKVLLDEEWLAALLSPPRTDAVACVPCATDLRVDADIETRPVRTDTGAEVGDESDQGMFATVPRTGARPVPTDRTRGQRRRLLTGLVALVALRGHP